VAGGWTTGATSGAADVAIDFTTADALLGNFRDMSS
jgi:hypothetical protein